MPLPDRFDLVTVDGQHLSAVHLPGPDREVALVLAHGFGGGMHRDYVAAIATGLAAHGGVLAFDFRGHGASSGRSTLGDREPLDVDAAVAAARRLGYRRVATIGFSMGGAAVVRHAGLLGELTREPVDAVVAVSTGARWYQRDTAPLRRLLWLVEHRAGRAVARLWPGVRINPGGWHELPLAPQDVVGRIAPVPLLLVHGDADHYFGVHHLEALRGAAGEPVESWLLEGVGHAEMGISPELLERLGARAREMALGAALGGLAPAVPA